MPESTPACFEECLSRKPKQSPVSQVFFLPIILTANDSSHTCRNRYETRPEDGIAQSEKLIVACVSVWYTKEVVTLLMRCMKSPFPSTCVNIEGNQLRRLAMAVSGGACCLALTACGTFASPDVKRGDQHLAAGNWEEASVAYRQALKDDPFEPSLQNKYRISRERAAAAHDERGRQLLKDRQFDQAAEEFKRALTIEPTSKEFEAGLTEVAMLKQRLSVPAGSVGRL